MEDSALEIVSDATPSSVLSLPLVVGFAVGAVVTAGGLIATKKIREKLAKRRTASEVTIPQTPEGFVYGQK